MWPDKLIERAALFRSLGNHMQVMRGHGGSPPIATLNIEVVEITPKSAARLF
jgi:hypothetical protein